MSTDDGAREVKQVIVIRRDLGMRRGKEIAQGAHAAMAWLRDQLIWDASGLTASFLPTLPQVIWMQGAFTKVVVQVPDEAGLLAVQAAAGAAGITAKKITDAGRTEFGGQPTVTALAVGPDWADRIDQVTGDLALY